MKVGLLTDHRPVPVHRVTLDCMVVGRARGNRREVWPSRVPSTPLVASGRAKGGMEVESQPAAAEYYSIGLQALGSRSRQSAVGEGQWNRTRLLQSSALSATVGLWSSGMAMAGMRMKQDGRSRTLVLLLRSIMDIDAISVIGRL